MGIVSGIKLIRTDKSVLILHKMFTRDMPPGDDTKMSKSTANEVAMRPRTLDICREAARIPLGTNSQVVHAIIMKRGTWIIQINETEATAASLCQ